MLLSLPTLQTSYMFAAQLPLRPSFQTRSIKIAYLLHRIPTPLLSPLAGLN